MAFIVPYLGYIAAAAAVAGAGVSAYSSYESGKASQAASLYQMQVAKNNETIAEQYAQAESGKADAEVAEKQRAVAQQEGAIRASAGASGLDANFGSSLLLQEDTARLGALDVETIRNNAAKAAYGYRVNGMSFGAQAGLDEEQGAYASRAGSLGMWSSIIGGASSVAGRWATYQKTGVFGGGP